MKKHECMGGQQPKPMPKENKSCKPVIMKAKPISKEGFFIK